MQPLIPDPSAELKSQILEYLGSEPTEFHDLKDIAAHIKKSRAFTLVLCDTMAESGTAKKSAHKIKQQYKITPKGQEILDGAEVLDGGNEAAWEEAEKIEKAEKQAAAEAKAEKAEKQTAEEETAEKAPAEKQTAKRRPVKPFTPNPTRGYEVQPGKVKIFLDRRATSRTLTLSIDDLRELVKAVEKAA